MDPFEEVLRVAASEVFPDATVEVFAETCVRLTDEQGGVSEYQCSIPERGSRGAPLEERVRTTVDYLRSFLVEAEAEADNEIPWDRLMPLIRPADLPLDPRAAGRLHTRPLAEHLVEIVGLDHPDVITMVTRADAQPWMVADHQLYEAARMSLARHEYQTSIEPIGATGQGAAFVVNPRGYELSWLVFPEIFAQPIGAMVNPTDGLSRQLIFPVSRNEMFVLPEADDKAVSAALWYAAELYVDDPRAVLPYALVVEDGRLRPWRRLGTRTGNTSWLQRRRYVRDQYGAQTSFLTHALEHDPRPPDPAPTILSVAGEGIMPTAATVEADAGQLVLPEVEYLDLRSPQGRVVVPWAQAAVILSLEVLAGWWPVRWTPGAWPVDEQRWQALRSVQVDPAILDREV